MRQLANHIADFNNVLTGGDLRSIGKANEVVKEVDNQNDFDILFSGFFHTDRKVVMRTADAIEKITLTKPGFLHKHKKTILELCSKAKHIELKWHLALLVPRIKLTPGERVKAWRLLTGWATDTKESKIVRVNSIQGLFDLSQINRKAGQDLSLTINEIEKENIPSLNARIKKLKNAGY